MFLYLSKILPLFVFPLGVACMLLVLALLIRRHRNWQTWLLVGAFALLWLGGNRIVTMTVVRSLEWRHLPPDVMPPADAIVVLGGATRAHAFPRPSHELNEAGDRLLYAARLYRQGVAPLVIVTGGRPVFVPEGASEAEAMADALVQMGVPPDVILLEDQARNTYENAIESSKVFAQEGLDHIILVTSAMHMPRAYGVFSKLDLAVTPAPTDFSVTQADWEYYTQPNPLVQAYNLVPGAEDLEWTTRAIKEYIGIAVYRLQGWL